MASPVEMAQTLMWEIGRCRPQHSPRQNKGGTKAFGFSLIEVLVVLVVLSIVIGFSGLSLRSLQGRGLSLDAERLGARIQAAQDEARLHARAIRMELDDRGYRFYRNQLGQWQLIEGDELLKPRAWEALTTWRQAQGLVEAGAANRPFVLAIGAEPIATPWALVLTRAEQAILLQSDGLGPIRQRSL